MGIDSEIPLRQAQFRLKPHVMMLPTTKHRLQAQNLLNLLVGQTVPQKPLPQQQISQITKQSALGAGLPSDLLNNRPDIKRLNINSVPQVRILRSESSAYPTISLTGSAGYASTDLSNLWKAGNTAWSIGPNISLPIRLGVHKANIKISETDQKIALANYEKSVQSAFRVQEFALATRANIGDRLTAQRCLVDATNTTYKLSNARFVQVLIVI